MKGKTKVLGIALAAVLVLSGVAAQTAMATHHFATERASVSVTGDIVGLGSHMLRTKPSGGAKIVCELAGGATNSSTTIGLTPSYSACKVGALPATVTDEGCEYVLDANEGTTGETGAAVSLDCNHEGQIQVHVYATGKKHENDEPGCVIIFSDTHNEEAVNQNLSGVTYHSEGEGVNRSVTATGEAGDIIYASTGSLCRSRVCRQQAPKAVMKAT